MKPSCGRFGTQSCWTKSVETIVQVPLQPHRNPTPFILNMLCLWSYAPPMRRVKSEWMETLMSFSVSLSISLFCPGARQAESTLIPLNALSQSHMGSKWTCQLCTTQNDLSLATCSFCAAESPSAKSATASASSQPVSASSSSKITDSRFTWQCRHCTLFNPFRIDRCDGCRTPRFKAEGSARTRSLPMASAASLAPPAKRPKYDELGMCSVSPLLPLFVTFVLLEACNIETKLCFPLSRLQSPPLTQNLLNRR